ncbi:acyl carrier protein [Klebsiella sp. BIGb0407]|uniref:acyl carrier protein n=1 Tax=Klebsiella sp. BIGb0407 TaxID=2940603 RepID=UPI0021685BFB|nr:acyl carrier protein [Klebsiella sp. BIGb0407]MCS3430266.1 acyl carrier protein [Klebsiella sp. BIGb0407]
MSVYDEVVEKVCEMICDAKDLEPDEVDEKTPLVRLKLDSLDYVELMVLAKREYSVTLEADWFIQNPAITVGELCQHIVNESGN